MRYVGAHLGPTTKNTFEVGVCEVCKSHLEVGTQIFQLSNSFAGPKFARGKKKEKGERRVERRSESLLAQHSVPVPKADFVAKPVRFPILQQTSNLRVKLRVKLPTSNWDKGDVCVGLARQNC